MLAELVEAFKEDVSGLVGLGVVSPYSGPYRYGTKNWWQWYATQYLPQYYNQQQILSVLQRSPYYAQYGSPLGYGSGYPYTGYPPSYPSYPSTYYPYGGQYPGSQYNYPYYGYANQYYDQNAVASYTDYQGQVGAAACQAQGGVWDYFQQACNVISGQQPYGNTVTGVAGQLPNVVGMAKWAAVAALNGAGYTVWLLNEDNVSGGTPPGYDPRRVDIAVANGVVTGAQVG